MPILYPICQDLPSAFIDKLYRDGATVHAWFIPPWADLVTLFHVQTGVAWSFVQSIQPSGAWFNNGPFVPAKSDWRTGTQANGVPFAAVECVIPVNGSLNPYWVDHFPIIVLTREVPGEGGGAVVVAYVATNSAPQYDENNCAHVELRLGFSNENYPTSPYG